METLMIWSSNHFDFPIVVVGFEVAKTTNSKTYITVWILVLLYANHLLQVAQPLSSQHPPPSDIGNSQYQSQKVLWELSVNNEYVLTD